MADTKSMWCSRCVCGAAVWGLVVAALMAVGACEQKPPAPVAAGPKPAASVPPVAKPVDAKPVVPPAPKVEPVKPPTVAAPKSAPVEQIAADGFPTSQATAEGAACDVQRAMIVADATAWRSVCFTTTPGTPQRDAYLDFLDERMRVIEHVKSTGNFAGGPKAIAGVFKARSLSKPEPGAYGNAVMRFDEVKFVDVKTVMMDGSDFTNRLLMVRDEGDQRWYHIPRPDLFPMLSDGLSGESASVELWKKK